MAHARIRHVNTAAAAAEPGVVGVFTYADFADVLKPIRPRIAAMPHFEDFLQLPLAVDKVRYVGEPVAVVVAIDPYVAEDAASLISAEIESLPPILNWQAANDRSLLIHENAGTNTTTVEVSRGDPDTAFKTAPYVRRFTVQRHTAIPMEARGSPRCGTPPSNASRCSASPRCHSSTAACSRPCSVCQKASSS
jgi:carbon-monoxide dehydrogenase large subunit